MREESWERGMEGERERGEGREEEKMFLSLSTICFNVYLNRFVDLQTMVRCTRVSRRWYQSVQDGLIWFKQFKRVFPALWQLEYYRSSPLFPLSSPLLSLLSPLTSLLSSFSSYLYFQKPKRRKCIFEGLVFYLQNMSFAKILQTSRHLHRLRYLSFYPFLPLPVSPCLLSSLRRV